jgi:hypothetical protein
MVMAVVGGVVAVNLRPKRLRPFCCGKNAFVLQGYDQRKPAPPTAHKKPARYQARLAQHHAGSR